MKRIFIYFSLFMCISLASISAKAQNKAIPTYYPSVKVFDQSGSEINTLSTDSKVLEAPLQLLLQANPQNDEEWSVTYEWIITDVNTSETILDRYIPDSETTFDVDKFGEYNVVCYATFVNGNDSIKCYQEYWANKNCQPFKFTIAESFLEFPNAFSPNGDQINDEYGPKGLKDGNKAPKSIIEYHMSIYNRWGQRLFDTHNIKDTWDGTYNGRDVKEGVYYVLCTAKGSDGIKYNIKKDVNLLRGKRARESSSSNY